MDINVQIKILENLLRLNENKECADCNSKTPRWASTTFGTFVCLRCSGKHRQLQVHITKVKSVNLDKWLPEMVELYKHLNNAFINSYWEARLPNNFQKPGPNASASEVDSFIKDKYLNKRWVDTSIKADPANLFWNDRQKFEKYKQQWISGSNAEDEEEEESEDEEERIRRKKEKKEKKKAKKLEKPDKDSKRTITTTAPTKPSVPVEDFINFNDTKPQTSLIDDFSDFHDGHGHTHSVNH